MKKQIVLEMLVMLIIIASLTFILQVLIFSKLDDLEGQIKNNTEVNNYKHYQALSNEIEKWDYKIYGETFSQAGYDYCIKNTNYSNEDCKYLNTCRKVKLYGDSYCDINCENFSYKMNITLDNINKAIPAQYVDISTDYGKCKPECYGEFRGLTCEAFGERR